MKYDELKKAILKYDDRPGEPYTVEFWGDMEVMLRPLTSRSRARVREIAIRVGVELGTRDDEAVGNALGLEGAGLFVDSICHPESGKPLFTLQEAELLDKKNGQALEPMFYRILKISKMAEEDVVEEKKDLSDTPNDGSSTK